jgi:ribA/ribD-fused uncharacterized protein
MTENIIGPFVGEYDYLSNFFPVAVVYKGKVYPTVEHAYVAAKTFDPDEQRKIRLYPPHLAGHVKKIGRGFKLRKDWEQVKDEIMMDLLYQKFKLPGLKKLLEDTGDLKIVEVNYWHDNYWGNCTCKKCKNIFGQNKLGKMLMQIRDNIKQGVLW